MSQQVRRLLNNVYLDLLVRGWLTNMRQVQVWREARAFNTATIAYGTPPAIMGRNLQICECRRGLRLDLSPV
jgi:hypothetical protein